MKTRYFLYVSILSIFASFSILTPVFAQNNSANLGQRIVGTAALNIRSQPWVGNNIIGYFNQGEKVTVIKKDSTQSWCQVEYQDRNDAWVYCPYLVKDSNTDQQHQAAPGQSAPNQAENVAVNVSALNVRSNPSMGNNIIGHLKRDNTVVIRERDNSGFWCKIDFPDQSNAWVGCKFLIKTSSTDQKHQAAPSQENATVNVAALNVRSEPRMGNNIVGHLKRANTVVIQERDSSGFWCRIDFQDQINAWVACKFLSKN